MGSRVHAVIAVTACLVAAAAGCTGGGAVDDTGATRRGPHQTSPQRADLPAQHMPKLSTDDPVGVTLTATGKPVVLGINPTDLHRTTPGGPLTLDVCTGGTCKTVRSYSFDGQYIHPTDVRVTDDNAVAVVAFDVSGKEPRLRVLSCATLTCAHVDRSPPLFTGDPMTLAADTTGEGGITIAYPVRVDGAPTLRLTHCPALACDNPTSVIVPTVNATSNWRAASTWHLAVDVAPGGRTAVAVAVRPNQEITVIECAGPACTNPRVRRVSSPLSEAPLAAAPNPRSSLDVVAVQGGEVLLTYNDALGNSRVARCGRERCAPAHILRRPGDGKYRGLLSVTLGPDGRPILATYDAQANRIVVLACPHRRCDQVTRVPVVTSSGRFGRIFEIMAGPEGRMRLVWTSRQGNSVHVFTFSHRRLIRAGSSSPPG